MKWLPGHEVTSVQSEGWSGISNGELISRMKGHFDIFITADHNLRYQQNLRNRRIAILELPTNRWPKLMPLKEAIQAEVATLKPSDYRVIP